MILYFIKHLSRESVKGADTHPCFTAIPSQQMWGHSPLNVKFIGKTFLNLSDLDKYNSLNLTENTNDW